ncbi:MAG: hypothetical protein WAX69_20030, partial [Victivallales bacterium]
TTPFPCFQNGSPTIELPHMELYFRHAVSAGKLIRRDERLGSTIGPSDLDPKHKKWYYFSYGCLAIAVVLAFLLIAAYKP